MTIRYRESNVLTTHVFGWGDVDEAQADLVIDETYSFPMITHFAIEPHAFAAAPVEDGIAIWSTIQHPYLLQKMMAEAAGSAPGQGARVRARSRRWLRRQAEHQARAAGGLHGPRTRAGRCAWC